MIPARRVVNLFLEVISWERNLPFVALLITLSFAPLPNCF